VEAAFFKGFLGKTVFFRGALLVSCGGLCGERGGEAVTFPGVKCTTGFSSLFSEGALISGMISPVISR
jgi:hypothetical protein